MTDWGSLKAACAACRNCGLCEERHNVVFGTGDESAEVMFIGEGPGEQEDLQGEPFVGPAGHLLDEMLELIGVQRSEVYIANIVKCRPPHNRDPLNTEQDACIPYLYDQIALIRPKIIVCPSTFSHRIRAIFSYSLSFTAEKTMIFSPSSSPAVSANASTALILCAPSTQTPGSTSSILPAHLSSDRLFCQRFGWPFSPVSQRMVSMASIAFPGWYFPILFNFHVVFP